MALTMRNPSPLWLAAEDDRDQRDRQLQADMRQRFVDLRADIETGARDTLSSDERRRKWRALALDLDDFMRDFANPALEEDE